MQETEIKLLFECGNLKTATITKVPLADGWCLQFARKGGGCEVLDSQRVSPRTFKTLDAAFQAVNRVGFREAIVAI
jgi:hypothetical protein